MIASLMVSSLGCAKKEEKEIKIGVILPLTGDAGVYGENMKKGIEVAKSDVENEFKVAIKIFYEDDQGSSTGSVNAYNKMVSANNLKYFIGGAMSSTASPLLPLLDKKQNILISPAASAPTLSGKSKYFFRVWASDVYEAQELAKLVSQFEVKKVCTVYVNNDYGKGASDIFTNTFTQLGGMIVEQEGYEIGNTDFRTQLTKCKTKHGEAIYIPGYQKELVHLLKQKKELGYSGKIFGGVGFYDPEIIRQVKGASEGVIFAAPYYSPDSKEKVISDFVGKYNTKFGKMPDTFSAHAYDAFKVLATSIVSSKRGNINEVKKYLLETDFSGVTGKIKFLETGDVEKPLRFFVIKNGSFEDVNVIGK